MSTHAWAEHVVHVDLVSDDPQVAAETVRFLEQRFVERDPEGRAATGRVRLHSEPERPVTAAEVAGALAEVGVRAHAVHERQEWSVTDVAPAASPTVTAERAGTSR